MGDSRSPPLFAMFFDFLAEQPDRPRNREFAMQLMRESMYFDFSSSEMDCDEALFKLGLAKRGHDPRYCEEGEEVVLYAVEDYEPG